MPEPPTLRTGRARGRFPSLSACGGAGQPGQPPAQPTGGGSGGGPSKDAQARPAGGEQEDQGVPQRQAGGPARGGQGQSPAVRASPCLSRAQSRPFPGFLPGIGARARTPKHSRVRRLAVSAASGRHKEVGELGSRAVSQPHPHVDSDLGSGAGLTLASPDPGRAHLPHSPAQPQRLDREAPRAPSLDTPVLVDVRSARTPWGRNAYVLIMSSPSGHAPG